MNRLKPMTGSNHSTPKTAMALPTPDLTRDPMKATHSSMHTRMQTWLRQASDASGFLRRLYVELKDPGQRDRAIAAGAFARERCRGMRPTASCNAPRYACEMITEECLETSVTGTEPSSSALPQPDPIDPEQERLIQMLQEPYRYRLGHRIVFFEELSERCGEEVRVYEFHHWREQSRIPAHLVPHVQALIDEKRQPKRSKKSAARP